MYEIQMSEENGFRERFLRKGFREAAEMKNNFTTLIYETQNDLDMLERIGLKGSPHWNSIILGMKRLKDCEAELRQMFDKIPSSTTDQFELGRASVFFSLLPICLNGLKRKKRRKN